MHASPERRHLRHITALGSEPPETAPEQKSREHLVAG
jgi:hypothetical protein